MTKCLWCNKEAIEDSTLCFECYWESLDDVEREEYNKWDEMENKL